jgi:putative oxidoreductase
MKIAAVISRYLLGLIFLVFGLNGFFHFIPMPPPTGVALQFSLALIATHYWVVIFGTQVIGGALLLVNRYVPLALVILGPVIVNIIGFHIFMAPAGLPLALVVTILWFILVARNWKYLAGILTPKTE